MVEITGSAFESNVVDVYIRSIDNAIKVKTIHTLNECFGEKLDYTMPSFLLVKYMKENGYTMHVNNGWERCVQSYDYMSVDTVIDFEKMIITDSKNKSATLNGNTYELVEQT